MTMADEKIPWKWIAALLVTAMGTGAMAWWQFGRDFEREYTKHLTDQFEYWAQQNRKDDRQDYQIESLRQSVLELRAGQELTTQDVRTVTRSVDRLVWRMEVVFPDASAANPEGAK